MKVKKIKTEIDCIFKGKKSGKCYELKIFANKCKIVKDCPNKKKAKKKKTIKKYYTSTAHL